MPGALHKTIHCFADLVLDPLVWGIPLPSADTDIHTGNVLPV